jgi:hypothetical protein
MLTEQAPLMTEEDVALVTAGLRELQALLQDPGECSRMFGAIIDVLSQPEQQRQLAEVQATAARLNASLRSRRG